MDKRIDSVEEGDVLALGFDGVHRGHQYLLGEAYRLAQERKRRLQILTFYPHPQIFSPLVEISSTLLLIEKSIF